MMSKPRIPPLGSLRAFEASARLLSFRLAGDELGVTQSAISHRISELETILGVKLFERLPRGVSLTDAGTLYYPYMRDAFEKIARGSALINRLGTTDDLAIETYSTFAIRWLIPRLSDFRKVNSNLAIRIGTSQLDWELNIDSSDIGIIHTTRPERLNLHYRLLAKAEMFPVCNPQVAARMGGGDAKALSNVPRLALYTSPEDWGTWLEAANIADTGRAVTLKFDTYLAALQSALDGQGVCVAPDFLVADDLRAGRLVAPFALRVPQPGAWYMICRKERVGEARIRQFERWLVEQFGGEPISS
ncbi:LysR family transcriptional regulator, glycine cleavage system transcriptional activator [Phyllobacterium sp. YR620]|uniref:LysR family transcriptional regulator n=1 Tax=Phyllobacterium pellucidum TaxID=2740464 RepID=A0A849VHL5_9HYPH|nr:MULTISPECIES: LysR substrate-binding domain-containing protein [Phyllobacterium]NTS29675.1 LysR family transcriptional regulator [Phyllobacterium pellucidum]UGY08442.1 LysR substrate-binding domain-containing protein [Phyllobacterium sp. T1018]SDP62441.1 LysR family transcriptional regulator, glycine cleavage system transcriptional activator [Phyllobacterium sp. YR620]SFJ12326.1 LysR family transcriptional regulator, glycine cleavage system transcriptional activator [Phyllobacterium sp. CL33